MNNFWKLYLARYLAICKYRSLHSVPILYPAAYVYKSTNSDTVVFSAKLKILTTYLKSVGKSLLNQKKIIYVAFFYYT